MSRHLKTKAFSELTGTSVRTLQYYDEIGLLKPAYVNEYGHRFYDAESFSRMFVILAMKEMGMGLQDISEYLNGGSFQLIAFIQEEMRRVERAISDLQLRLMRLSELKKQAASRRDITPAVLPLFSHLAGRDLSADEIERFIENSKQEPAIDLKAWDDFVEDLNFCCENDLPITDERAAACVAFWKEQVIRAHNADDALIRLAQDYYRKHPQNGFGITSKTYLYLSKMLGACPG